MSPAPGTTVRVYHHGFLYPAVADREGRFRCGCCGKEIPWIVW